MNDSEIIGDLMREMGFNPRHLSTKLKICFLKIKHRKTLSQIESDLHVMGCNSPVYYSFAAILIERFHSGGVLRLAACRLIDWRHQWGSNWAYHLFLLKGLVQRGCDSDLQKDIWRAMMDGVGEQERLGLVQSLESEMLGSGIFLGYGPMFE